ncbi:MAG: DUF1624 domain-containing protein [Methyloceanibacter sp.]
MKTAGSMHASAGKDVFTAAASTVPAPAAPARPRLQSIDLMRGLVVALMALDHTREYFSDTGLNPRHVTEPVLFLTRWITHLCAPTFVLLAGISAYLYTTRGKTTGEVSRFLLTRGLWLILIEFTLIRFGWTFDPNFFYDPVAGIIWVIGASMVALAAIIYLPRWAILALGLGMIAGHNLLDGTEAGRLGSAAPLWHVLHEPGRIGINPQFSFYILYPLIPWIGVMALGYGLGPVMQLEPSERRHVLFWLGAAVTLGFILLRAVNLYGDPGPWSGQASPLATVLSFINCEKYPPSLLYLMMTLGPALMLLSVKEHTRGRIADWLTVYGRVPFFFYVVHIYLIHLLAVAAGLALTGKFEIGESGVDLGLPAVYLVWLVVLVLLYPTCRWFAALKQRRRDWWLSYL